MNWYQRTKLWFCICLSIKILSYKISLRYVFRVVISATIFAQKRCSIRLYLQLFVGGAMSYLLYLCLFVYNGVQTHIVLCFCLVCLLLVSCVPNVASFSGLSILNKYNYKLLISVVEIKHAFHSEQFSIDYDIIFNIWLYCI